MLSVKRKKSECDASCLITRGIVYVYAYRISEATDLYIHFKMGYGKSCIFL